ncbi:hypothetical protein JOB18_044288 [Solea senegalensis]|uniref:Uncharacterized protein n=1 Tax=Solea senegalensis TaxID=28829 RepID=A0AAV6R9U8_SOLSE|nr:hypothetical protein JOB18_044288 [Solea senegalensis]
MKREGQTVFMLHKANRASQRYTVRTLCSCCNIINTPWIKPPCGSTPESPDAAGNTSVDLTADLGSAMIVLGPLLDELHLDGDVARDAAAPYITGRTTVDEAHGLHLKHKVWVCEGSEVTAVGEASISSRNANAFTLFGGASFAQLCRKLFYSSQPITDERQTSCCCYVIWFQSL